MQTWFPFSTTIFLNGLEWLAQQLEQVGMRHRGIGTASHAVHPRFAELCLRYPMQYYWTCQDSEWAMDLVFRDAEQLRRLYPQLV